MPKIAIAFFGLIRHGQSTYASLEKNVFGVLDSAQYEYDTYCHTYDLPFISNPRSGENHRIDNAPRYAHLLGRNGVSIETQHVIDTTPYETHGDPWHDSFRSLHNLLCQFRSLHAVTALWADAPSTYDAVIYLRSDMIYSDPLDLNALGWVVGGDKGGEQRLVTPQWHTFRGLNDRLAFGTPAAMLHYGRRGDAALEYASRAPLHSETFLKAHMRTAANTIIRLTPQRALRVRADGRVAPGDRELQP